MQADPGAVGAWGFGGRCGGMREGYLQRRVDVSDVACLPTGDCRHSSPTTKRLPHTATAQRHARTVNVMQASLETVAKMLTHLHARMDAVAMADASLACACASAAGGE
jgi:hypothetical protein